ncbi:MAG: methyltransferase domain-containing protein [Comamonas sp.]|nr:methyltransferase domain-containing protein [Comamonas sp.]
MSETNRVVHPWNATASGQYLLDWEQQRCDEAVSDIFGYHSLQWGMPMLQGLRTNRMPHRWLALESPEQAAWCPLAAQGDGTAPQDSPRWTPAFYADFRALPLADACMDLLILPHTLELSPDPHATLREVARVLMPEGKVLIFGLNPWSLWGAQHALERPAEDAANATRGIAYLRLRDWLRLMELEIEAVDFGAFTPHVQQLRWQQRWDWMNRVGAKTWPILGAVYCVVAIKRVQGMRLLEPGWRTRRANAPGAVPVAQRNPSSKYKDMKL